MQTQHGSPQALFYPVEYKLGKKVYFGARMVVNLDEKNDLSISILFHVQPHLFPIKWNSQAFYTSDTFGSVYVHCIDSTIGPEIEPLECLPWLHPEKCCRGLREEVATLILLPSGHGVRELLQEG